MYKFKLYFIKPASNQSMKLIKTLNFQEYAKKRNNFQNTYEIQSKKFDTNIYIYIYIHREAVK